MSHKGIMYYTVNRAAEREAFVGRLPFYFLWGITITLASSLHFLLAEFTGVSRPYAAWSLIVLAIAWSVLLGVRSKSVQGPAEKPCVRRVWQVFILGHLAVIVAGLWADIAFTPLIFFLAAVASTATALLIGFRPLLAGGVLMGICAAATLLLDPHWHLLLTPLAILITFLLPLWWLHRQSQAN